MTDDKQPVRIIFGFVVIIWLALVFVLYYLGHKPFTPTIASSLVRSAGYLLAALALISVGGGLGKRILPSESAYPLEDLTLQAALGLGLLSIAFFFAGWILGLYTWIAWISLIVPAYLLRREILGWWLLWKGLAPAWKTAGILGKSIAVMTVLILGFTLYVALAPPLKFDSLVYHMALPKGYIQAGRIEFNSSNVFWGMPQLSEALYTWGMIIAGGERALETAACLGWGAGLLALLGLLGSASRTYGSVGWVAVASVMAGSTVATELEWGYAEWFTILYGSAFLVSLDRWRETRTVTWILAAGVFAGFAFGTKYSAGALLIAGVIIFGWIGWRDRVQKKGWLDIAIFLASAVAAASPWLIKNWLVTGNPLYPFLFPAAQMDAFRLSFYQGIPIWGDWRDMLLLPWMATFSGYEGAPGYSASVGPLLLCLAIIYPIGHWLRIGGKTPSAGVAAPMALVGLLVWVVAGRMAGLLIQTRLYMAFLPAFAILAAGGFFILERIELGNVRLGRVAGSLVLLALGLNTLQVGIDSITRNPGSTLVGVQPAEDYLTNNLGWYPHAMQKIKDLPGTPKVLMLWEPRSLYCLPLCDPDEILDRWLYDYRTYRSPEAILESWRDAGYTHLLYNRSGANFVSGDDDRYTPEDWQALDRLLEGLPPPTNSGEAYSLYTLAP